MKATNKLIKEQLHAIHEISCDNNVAVQTRRALFHALCWFMSPDEYLAPDAWLKEINEQKIYKDVL